MKKEFKIKYLHQKNIYEARITLNPELNGETSIKYIDMDDVWVEKDVHLFSTFCKLREYLVTKDKILLCKGCRVDIHPSGSQLKWIFAYILKLGVRVNPDADKVMLFDEESDINKIATVTDQKEFYKRWLESIDGLPYQSHQINR